MVVANTKQSSTAKDTLSHIDQVLQQITSRSNASAQWVATQTSVTIDKAVTPEQRRELSRRAQGFMQTNPRLAAFLATNIVLSGIPILLFITFSVSTLVFSVLTGLVLGLVSALAFTVTSVGVALLVLLPTVFFTTLAAVFLFAWGLVGFTTLSWASQQRNKIGTKRPGPVQHNQDLEDEKLYKIQHHTPADDLQFSGSKQQGKPFEFASQKQLPLANQTQSTVTAGTALPTDRKLTENVKQEHARDSIKVPTATTTGMVAS